MFKLLIVDDEPLERLALRKIIKRFFFNITILEDAKNGIEAIEKGKLYRPDIILMDIRMPEITGLEAQKRIIKVLPDVKTIILTAYNEFDYAQQAIKYGIVEYLLKPVKPVDLQASVNLAIDALLKEGIQKKSSSLGTDILTNILNYIEHNYCSDLTLDAVAKFVHLNTQYFSRYFKKTLGITFTEYVTKLRIEKAKKLLAETNYPVYRIASEVGFSDSAYFNKVFVKCEQQPPHKYKQMIKQSS